MKEIVVVADDKVGLIAEMSYLLSKSKINIDAVSFEKVGNQGIIHLSIKDEKKAIDVLQANGFRVVTSDILVVKLLDAPGEMAKLSKILSDGGVNIENMHILTKGEHHALFALKVDKIKKAEKLLGEYLHNANALSE